MYELSLKGKNVFLTGSRGIARAIAIGFAQAGANLAIVARTQLHLDETKKLVREAGSTNVRTYQCDIGDISKAKETVQQVISDFGQIDVFMGVAGINYPIKILDVTEKDWDALMDVNAKAPFFLCQEIGRHMIKRGIHGVLINTTSECQDIVEVNTGAYCPSKGALKMVTKLLATEWGPYGIRVCNLAPCFINTELNEPMIHSEDPEMQKFFKNKLSRVPMARYGEPEDIVGAALYLASDKAAYTSGITLICDGGYTSR